MKEKNRIKLKKGLHNLPEYDPPKDLWNQIEGEMDQSEADVVLKKGIASLPTYDPPVELWDSIESALPKGKVVAMKKAESKRSISKWLAAASIAMLMGLGIWWATNSEQWSDETKISYSHKTMDAFNQERAPDKAGEMIAQVINEVKAVQHQWESPETVALKGSLDKLKMSIAQFQSDGEKFGMNQRMHEQLTDMYNKRNKIVRQLASKI